MLRKKQHGLVFYTKFEFLATTSQLVKEFLINCTVLARRVNTLCMLLKVDTQ